MNNFYVSNIYMVYCLASFTKNKCGFPPRLDQNKTERKISALMHYEDRDTELK